MNKKIIGLTGNSQFTPQVREMVEKHFNAIPLDLMQNGADDLARVANFCDGFIFAGGSDICPTSLAEKREVQHGLGYTKFDKKRDLRELALIDIAAAQGKSIFGICRGHQMLLSHAGLYLLPDISHHNSDVCHNPRDIEMQGEPVHYVEGVGAGIVEFGEQELVNSFHHQAIALDEATAIAMGVEILGISTTNYATAKTDAEFIVELARGKNFLSCQWHPEVDWDYIESSRKVLDMAKAMFKIK